MAEDPDSRTLYIGNVDKNVSEEVLYELFLQAGPVERVNIQNNNRDSCYGFVTFKHEVSVDYAIDLLKGTKLYKRELLIKRKGDRSNNSQQKYDDSNHNRLNSGFQDFIQDKLSNHNNGPSSVNNFSHNSLKGNWSSRNKPYDRGPRNHYPRPREPRDRHKDRDYGNKPYFGRKNRQ